MLGLGNFMAPVAKTGLEGVSFPEDKSMIIPTGLAFSYWDGANMTGGKI